MVHQTSIPALALVDDDVFDQHEAPPGHPERPERLAACRRGLRTAVDRLGAPLRPLTIRRATPEELTRVHRESFVDDIVALEGRRGFLDPDTFHSPRSIDAALRASGSAVVLVDELLRGEANRGVALLRPPGHHAESGRAMGFCLFNHVAVGAAHARSLGAPRVAIVDFDVHHGNGTEAIFYDDPSVLYLSLHQFPFYPGTGRVSDRGEGDGLGTTVNIPLSEGAGSEAYRRAMRDLVTPVLEQFDADLLLISAGFDAHRRDPLAGMLLESDDFAYMTRELTRAAGGRPVACFLEGGYDLEALETSVDASAGALLGELPTGDSGEAPAAEIRPVHVEDLERARRAHQGRWRL